MPPCSLAGNFQLPVSYYLLFILKGQIVNKRKHIFVFLMTYHRRHASVIEMEPRPQVTQLQGRHNAEVTSFFCLLTLELIRRTAAALYLITGMSFCFEPT